MSEQHAQGADAVADLNNELKTRREKLANLREQGIPFPNDFRRDHTSDQLHADFDAKENEELEALNIEVSVAGRMMTRRIMGKASFVTLQDVGGRIQLYVARDDLPEGIYNEQFKKWDLGDILGAKGKLFKTKTGELSIHCTELRLLTKALRPLPDKFHGLQDQEARYRQRYLDLISNDESRNTFKVRSQIMAGIRQFMVGRGFMEVETPMMQVIPGGAAARPFITHHNALVSLRPFRAGEIVQIGAVTGTVEKVHLFSTTLLTADSKEVVIPNGKIISDNIINYSRHPFRRIDLVIGVGYQSRIAEVKRVITHIIEQDKRVDQSRGVTVRLGELAASSLNFYVRVWVRNGEYWNTYYDLLENIKEAMDANHIDLPYPQMDIRVQNVPSQSQPQLQLVD